MSLNHWFMFGPDLSLPGLMRVWCSRPRMFLVGHPDFKEPKVEVLRGLIIGYEAALRKRGLPSEEEPFRAWVEARHPEFQGTWYMNALPQAFNHDQEAVFRELERWLNEYCESSQEK